MNIKMNITQAQYTNVFGTDVKASIKATIDGVEIFVPLNTANRHYAEILKQVAEGTITIAEAD